MVESEEDESTSEASDYEDDSDMSDEDDYDQGPVDLVNDPGVQIFHGETGQQTGDEPLPALGDPSLYGDAVPPQGWMDESGVHWVPYENPWSEHTVVTCSPDTEATVDLAKEP